METEEGVIINLTEYMEDLGQILSGLCLRLVQHRDNKYEDTIEFES